MRMQRATAHWLATRDIETELRGDEQAAWIPVEHLADFYDLVYGGGDPNGIKGEIMQGGDFYVNLTDLEPYI